MSNIVPFQFNNLPVRTISNNGAVWFVASDVCAILELTNTTVALENLDEDERSKFNLGRSPVTGGGGEVNIINESGLYALILRSRKKEAKRFRKWVTSEVLPQIRKTGVYCPVITLTPEQQRQIQVAVAGKALGSSVAFRSIYRILKDHFKVGSYKQIPSIRFSEAIEVIQNVRLRLTNVDDKTDSVDVCTITFTELNNLASLARLFLIAKPEMLRIYKVLSELDSPLAPRVYSLATEPVFAFGLLERLFSRHGIDIRDCQKQLAR